MGVYVITLSDKHHLSFSACLLIVLAQSTGETAHMRGEIAMEIDK
jgi:hypothetical protein